MPAYRSLASAFRVVSCLTLVSGQAAAQTPQPAANVLTLGDAVREALVHNDRMLNEQDSIEQARLGVRLARNDFRPKVVPNIQGSFGRTDLINQTYRLDVSQRLATGTELRAGFGAATAQIPMSLPGEDDLHFYNADTTLTLSQPLLRGFGPGVARRALASAEARQADAGHQRVLVEQAVAVDIARAYYAIVAQQAMVGVARSSLERARKLRDSAEAKLDAGLVSQLDVLRAQQLVSQAELQLFDAQAFVEDARDQLRFLIGRDSSAPFEVETEIPRATDLIGGDEAAAVALDNRVDLQRASSAADEAERTISFTRNQLLPQFDVNLALTRRGTADSLTSSFGLDRFQFATFFAVSMPLDRTPALVEHNNALIERDRRRREIDTLRKRVVDDVKRAARQRDRVVRNLAAADANILLARQEVEVAELRYERGLSNNLDVVTAAGNLLNTESRRIATLAELAVARLALRAAMGILDPQKDLIDPAASRTGEQ
jgi:outer membrane protein TolC